MTTLDIGAEFRHALDPEGRTFVVATLPDARGWFAYTIKGEDGTRYSGNVRDIRDMEVFRDNA